MCFHKLKTLATALSTIKGSSRTVEEPPPHPEQDNVRQSRRSQHDEDDAATAGLEEFLRLSDDPKGFAVLQTIMLVQPYTEQLHENLIFNQPWTWAQEEEEEVTGLKTATWRIKRQEIKGNLEKWRSFVRCQHFTISGYDPSTSASETGLLLRNFN